MVWPKLRIRRLPPSRSSSATTSAFSLAQRPITFVSNSGFANFRRSSRLLEIKSKISLSKIAPYFITSPMAEEISRSGNDSNNLGSITTAFGCQMTPTKFFPAGRFTPVFPPIDESTIANNVVGI